MKTGMLCLLIAAPAFAQETISIDTALARQYFTEAERLAAADDGKLWGVSLRSPMLFADPATHQVVASAPDAEGRLRPQGGVFVGVLPENHIIANNDTHWSGTHWTMLRWPLPENRYARRRLLAHELFHRVQDTLQLTTRDVANGHLAFGEGRILLRLEWRALAEALMRAGAERRQAIADALMFRAQRHAQFAGAAVEEQQLELNEGIAEYTGFRLSGLPQDVLLDRAAVQLNSYEQMDNFARSFAYASGPAYGLLLDAAAPQWRAQLTSSSDLGQLLRDAYRIRPTDAARMESRIAFYEAERMVREERARIAERIAAQERLRARLVDGPTLTLPVRSEFNYGFDPNAAIPLEGLGTAYLNLRVSDEWGTLVVEGGGALLLRNEQGHVTGVVVSAPLAAADPAKGDGWTLTLRDGWRVAPAARTGSFVVK